MSKLRSLVHRGVKVVVADGPADPATTPREIPAEAFSTGELPLGTSYADVPASTTDFRPVYERAGVAGPRHGYGIDKVAQMLESPRLASVPREVRAAAVMAALEAADVPLVDVLNDAVLRDKALDAFLAAKEREFEHRRTRWEAHASTIREEIDAYVRERQDQITALTAEVLAADQAIDKLRARKRTEEQRLRDLVSYFRKDDNPIAVTG